MKPRHEFHDQQDYHEYLRTYFAAMAMQAILSRPDWDMSFKYVAQDAINEADQLLKRLDNA